jgi:hypothetical protein
MIQSVLDKHVAEWTSREGEVDMVVASKRLTCEVRDFQEVRACEVRGFQEAGACEVYGFPAEPHRFPLQDLRFR